MHQYRNKPREFRLKEIFFGQSLVALIILLITLYLVIYGFGYKIDFKNRRVMHTGIIYITYYPRDAKVIISNADKGNSSPFDIALLPGNYDTRLKKDGYNTWVQNVSVSPDKVTSYKNVVLFKVNPEISVLTDKNSISSIDAPYDNLIKNPGGNLTSNNYEIWSGDRLITRFSKEISGVIWYPGMEYIGYQQGDEIRIIDKYGTNDNLLVKLSSANVTKYIFSWDGSSLLYKDGTDYKRAIIN
jgi:hypothetical protein